MNIQHSSNYSFAVRLSVVVMLAINAACASKSGAEHEAAPPPTTVVVAEVSQRTVPIYSEFVGQTRAEETVELRARVEGVLQKVYFKEGSAVKKGQLLFTIDKRPFQAAVQSAKALVAKAVSDLAQAQQRTDVLEAQAQLANAQATLTRADQDVARLAPLAKEKAVTEQDLDAAIATQKSARATVEARQANVTNLESTVKYTIERAKAEVSASNARVIQTELELTRVERGGRSTEIATIRGALIEQVDVRDEWRRRSLVETIEEIEAFGDQLQPEPLANRHQFRHAHIERHVTVRQSEIASQTATRKHAVRNQRRAARCARHAQRSISEH